MTEAIQTNKVGVTRSLLKDLNSQNSMGRLSSKDLNSQDSSVVSEAKKTRKGMLPAEVSRQNLEKQEESLLKEKVETILSEVKTAVKKSGFDPRVTNILMLYIAFAQNQMNQNNKLQEGWMDQQHVQNLLLEDSAREQKKIANESTQGRHANIGAIIGFALLAVIGIALVFTGIGAAAGAGMLGGAMATAAAATSGYVIAGAGAMVGIGVSLGFAIPAMNNPAAPGLEGVTQEGPDQAKLSNISILNAFWNLLAQMANQRIQTGTQLNVVQPSSSNTQLGQQAAGTIEDWGRMSRIQVAMGG